MLKMIKLKKPIINNVILHNFKGEKSVKKKLFTLGVSLLAMFLAVTPVMAASTKKAAKPVKSAGVAQTAVKLKFTKANFATTALESKLIGGFKIGTQIVVPVKAIVDYNGDTFTFSAKTNVVTISHRGENISLKAAKVINKAAYVEINKYANAMNMRFDAKKLEVKNNTARVQEQWVTSAHNSANFLDEIKNYTPLKPFENTNSNYRCINCHNGLAFQGEATASSVDLKDVSINCVTCHVKGGALLYGNGTVTLNNFQAGTGGATFTDVGPSTVCISCHIGRGKTADVIATDGSISASQSAPHGSIQTDVLYGFGGYEYGKALPTSPHAANPEACIGCHMAPTKAGVRSHAFKITNENAVNACGICHKGLGSLERRALADYDGDRQFESIQGEVEGLLTAVDSAILDEVAKTNPTVVKYAIVAGKIQFQDANSAAVTGVDSKFFFAAWNKLTVENDGSKGIHNPAYVISLLQQTYKQIKGVDIPGATIR